MKVWQFLNFTAICKWGETIENYLGAALQRNGKSSHIYLYILYICIIISYHLKHNVYDLMLKHSI